MKIFDPKLTGSIEILNTISGNVTIAGGLNVEGSLGGAVTGSATASYIEYSNVANKPSLISSSAQLIGQTIDGDLTVGGILTAQEFHTEFVSASIVYQSGSTQFGDSVDDTHTFTGSIDITGSVKADVAEAIIFQTPKFFTQTYTLPQEYNALLIGPTTLQGQITVSSGSNLTVV